MLPVGYRIYQYRIKFGCTQQELAKRCGVPQSNLSNIEKGKRDLSLSTLLRIAKALKVPAEILIKEDAGSSAIPLTRQNVEAIAKSVVYPEARVSREIKELAALFRQVLIPSGRESIRNITDAWVCLRQRFSSQQIRSISNRVEDARQRKP